MSVLTPRKAINKSYLKVKPNRSHFDEFKHNFIQVINRINEKETEEHHKNLLIQFLNNTYYSPTYYVNTKERKDLVIHNGKKSDSSVGVILEVKQPINKLEMVKKDNLNAKAMHELLYYYLEERIINENLEIKNLIITNIYEWYIFDAHEFEKIFAKDKTLIKKFKDFKNGRLSGKTTEFFYKEVAEPAIKLLELNDLPFTHMDIRNYSAALKSDKKKNENKLIPIYKLFSPENLLKLPFENDNNFLNKKFYTELLHIIGLSEEKSKKTITREKKDSRNDGSLIENTMDQLESLDKISRLKNPSHFGENYEERLFNVALELVINWVNRILFLKLLEGQLIDYHKSDMRYSFLNYNKINSYDDLNTLFFSVLSNKIENRSEYLNAFAHVPYLNSSLFEPAELEHSCFSISQLREVSMPLINSTVLKNTKGKKKIGSLNALEYFFEFLNSYDFSSEGKEAVQEENKTLINASVLGLIFEKINGYKDGSYFTPGYITMFMSNDTIRRSIISKFNEVKKWNCNNLDDLYDKIEDKEEANEIINQIRICDPAVGSGHFLVSALNEIIAVKSDLKILLDRNGRTLRDYDVEVVNDELIVTDEDGEFFKYNPQNTESQRIQETLFHEKKTIIENCLFGVDINPNSVNICRLRLWIELLKNSYYKNNTNELETLPNIDINIKCGNSLVSRYPLDTSLGKITKKSKFTIPDYLQTVNKYRNAKSKEEKHEMEELINQIKNNFETEINFNDKRFKRLLSLEEEYLFITNQTTFFERTKKEEKAYKEKVKKMKKTINTLKSELDEIKNNKIYEDAFEWRIEFPEVLNENGKFRGFDVVIGNPPYLYRNADINHLKKYFRTTYYNDSGNYDLYKYFIEKSNELLAPNGINSLITNSSFLLQSTYAKTREFILENSNIKLLAPLGPKVFDEATVDTVIYTVIKNSDNNIETEVILPEVPELIASTESYIINQERFNQNDKFVFDCYLNEQEYSIVQNIFEEFPYIEKGFEFGVGINTGSIKSELTSETRLDKRYHPMVPGSGIERYGNVKTDGFIMYDKEFVKSKGKKGRALPNERFLKEEKILVVRTRNISLKQRIIATIDTANKYNLNRLSNIISREGYNLYGLLGILNSSLFNWLYSKRFLDYEIKPVYLRVSPMADVNNPVLVGLVKDLLDYNLNSINQNKEYIEKLEVQINELVYELYGLSEEEIKLIERNI